MGFSFKGLTSAALVNKDAAGANAAEKDVADVPASVAGHTSMDAHRGGDEKLGSPRSYDGSDDDELNKVDTTAEQGVQKVQAMTMVWTKKKIIMAYINVWLLAFILAFTSGSVTLLTPYVTSSFQAHSLTALTGVISSLVAGIWKLPFAKIMNIWGRPLALSIYSYQPHTWTSPLIISFILFGALLIISFGLWEKYAAPVTFIPWALLKNRTVLFTYTMAGSLYTGWYIWDSDLYSSLVVLFHQPLLHAGYITQTYTMGSCLCSLLYGLALRAYSGQVKRYALVLGVPLTILGVALVIPFRTPDTNVGYIVMCLVFIAVGGAILVISEQTTLMAVSEQRDFPALLAMEAMVIAVGSAVGSTIAGAIWTGVFPARLEANLPPDAMADFAAIYGEMDTQAGYPVGSPTRAAIDWSYAQTQRYMLIAGTAVYVVTWVSVALWEDVDVRTMKQRTVGLL